MEFVDASGVVWWCASDDGEGLWTSSTGKQLGSADFFFDYPEALSIVCSSKQKQTGSCCSCSAGNNIGVAEYVPKSGSHYEQYTEAGMA
jgi:hypothetical protein